VTRAGPVATGSLGSDGSVFFQVTPTQKRTRYAVLLRATADHTADHAAITVIVKKPGGTGSPGTGSG
jgi:hypothetical protein